MFQIRLFSCILLLYISKTEFVESFTPSQYTISKLITNVSTGDYDDLYSIDVNRSIEYIFEFMSEELSWFQPARITVESDHFNRSYPILIVVRQQEGILPWQLPMMVEKKSGTLGYNRTSRTLCPYNNYYSPRALEPVSRKVTVGVSTASPTNLRLNLSVTIEQDFYINMAQKRKATSDLQHPRFGCNEEDEISTFSRKLISNGESSNVMFGFPTSKLPLKVLHKPLTTIRKDSKMDILGIKSSQTTNFKSSDNQLRVTNQKRNKFDNTLTTDNGVDSNDSDSDSDSDVTFDENTQRSTHFLKEIAIVNQQFSKWIQEVVQKDPTALLTRTFIDHQRHVQRIFDEERKRDMTDTQAARLDRQEEVLHLLKETTTLASGFDRIATPANKFEKPVELNKEKRLGNPFLSNDTPPTKSQNPETTFKVTCTDSPFSSKLTTASTFNKSNVDSVSKTPQSGWGSPAFSKPFSSVSSPSTTAPEFSFLGNKDKPFSCNPTTKSEVKTDGSPADKDKKQAEAVNHLFVNPFLSNPNKPSVGTPAVTALSSSPMSFAGASSIMNGNVDRMKSNPFFSPPTSVTSVNVNGTAAAPTTAPSNFQGFSFASAVSQALDSKKAEEDAEGVADEDAPPKVEFTPVVEEGSVYTKRCKVFFKKETGGGYEDRGVGNLFLKPVADSSRTQLIVRADTNLGNLLINVLLSPDVPVQKMKSNNVMIVCIPTPGATLRTVLLRVKTEGDADEAIAKLKACS